MDKTLPEELIFEILLKLPVKSLVRFRSVCKAWNGLIKSQNFITLHQKQKNEECILITRFVNKKKLLSFHSRESLTRISSNIEIPYKFYQSPESAMFCNTPQVSFPCNGLICFSDKQNIILSNPATRDFKVLPSPNFFASSSKVYVKAFGLGFDSCENEYKVVAFMDFGKKTGIIGVYNLSTNTWRKLKFESPQMYALGAPLDGVLHWVTRTLAEYKDSIITFDLNKEVFGEMKFPNDTSGRSLYKVMKVVKDCLSVFDYRYHNGIQQFIDVWVMKEYGVVKSWSREVRVGPLQEIVVYRPHLLWRDETAILCEADNGDIVSYALGSSHEITRFGLRGDCVMLYQESLVSLS